MGGSCVKNRLFPTSIAHNGGRKREYLELRGNLAGLHRVEVKKKKGGRKRAKQNAYENHK